MLESLGLRLGLSCGRRSAPAPSAPTPWLDPGVTAYQDAGGTTPATAADDPVFAWETSGGVLLAGEDTGDGYFFLRDDGGKLVVETQDFPAELIGTETGPGETSQFDLLFAFKVTSTPGFGGTAGYLTTSDVAGAAFQFTLGVLSGNITATARFRHTAVGGAGATNASISSGQIGAAGPWWWVRATFDAVNVVYKCRIYDASGVLLKNVDGTVAAGRRLQLGGSVTAGWMCGSMDVPQRYGFVYRRYGGVYSDAEVAAAIANGYG